MTIHICEAVVNQTQDGITIPVIRICGKVATHRVYGNLGREYWVCDHHQKDFAPEVLAQRRLGILPT